MPSVSTTRAEGDAAGGLRREPAAEQEILPDAEMRKQARVLEYEADAAAIGGKEDALSGVDEDAAVEDDPAAIGAREPCD